MNLIAIIVILKYKKSSVLNLATQINR